MGKLKDNVLKLEEENLLDNEEHPDHQTQQKKIGSQKQASCAPLCRWIPARYMLCFMAFLGFFNMYTLRNTLSVAIVAMMDKGVIPREIWNFPSQDVIPQAFYPAYIVSNIFSGSLTSRFGCKIAVGLGMGLNSAVTFLVPVAATHGYIWLMTVRVFQGIAQGLAITALYGSFSKWLPRSKRASLRSLAGTGFSVAYLVGHPITGYLCKWQFLDGWPTVFYLFSMLAAIWTVLWMFVIYESPQSHPWISAKELNYILRNQGEEAVEENLPVPWKKILTSSAVLSLAACGIIGSVFTEFVRQIYPTYLRLVYKFDISEIGWISSIPYYMEISISILSSILADYIVARNPISRRTLIRKIFHTVAIGLTALPLLGVIYFRESRITVVCFLTASLGFHAINSGGSVLGPLEISPAFTVSVYGLVNGLSNLSAFISPLIMGAITAKNQSASETWNPVFYLAMAGSTASIIVYLLFGSADVQPWGNGAKSKPEEESPDDTDSFEKNYVSFEMQTNSLWNQRTDLHK